MMINGLIEKLKAKKYLILVLIAGIVLMLIPDLLSGNKPDGEKIHATESMDDEKKLEKTLKKIEGVKNCSVYVTYENNGENKFAYDVRSGSNAEIELKVSDKEPVVKSERLPEIRGILAIVNGDNVSEAEVTYMIKRATGVPMHRIYVKIFEGE